MSMRSAWPALGISVLTAVALFVAQLMIVLWPEALWLHDSPIETITVTLWLFSCVGAIAAVGAMLFGPLWLMISAALRLSGVVGYFLAGTIAGALVGLPTASLLVSPDRDTIRVWDQQDHTGEFALTVVWFAALGFSIAAIYWLIRRPDLDAAGGRLIVMSEQEKYTSHMLHAPNGGAIEAVAWWLAPMIAALPALVVGAFAELADAEHVRANAIVWGIGAALAASALEGWRGITKRFAGLPLSTAFTIAAIVGGAVGMIAGLTASTSAGFGIRLFCGFAGAVQGGALAWFIVRPDLAPPEVQEDAPNPPTPAP